MPRRFVECLALGIHFPGDDARQDSENGRALLQMIFPTQTVYQNGNEADLKCELRESLNDENADPQKSQRGRKRNSGITREKYQLEETDRHAGRNPSGLRHFGNDMVKPSYRQAAGKNCRGSYEPNQRKEISIS